MTSSIINKIPLALLGASALILMVPLLNNTNLMNGIQSAKTFGFLYGIMVLALVVGVQKSFSRNNTALRFSLIDVLLVVFVLWVSANKFLLQSTASFSLKYFELIALLVLYFCTRCIKREHSVYLLTAICVAGLIQAVYGNLQLWGYYPSHHGLFKMTGSFFNPGPYAGFLCAVFPVAVGLYWMHGDFRFQISDFRLISNLKFKISDYSEPAILNLNRRSTERSVVKPEICNLKSLICNEI
jgi:O-antigen polymerase